MKENVNFNAIDFLLREENKAKQNYENILSIDPKNFKANKGMARLCIKFGNHKMGMQFLQKSEGLLRFNEKNYEILF